MNSLPLLSLRSPGLLCQTRLLVRPPKNLPYRGIYRTEGEQVRKGELLVCQGKFNYHPGLNVFYENDRGEKLLKADCDGMVRITTETVQPDMSLPEMDCYAYRRDIEMRKLTFNVIPLAMSRTFTLQSQA